MYICRISANYAIFYEERKLWEVKGNVVAKNSDNQTLYTQQLFWDQKSKRIYSNVDCKVLMGQDYWFGEGFESDEELKNWHFRRYRGRMWIDAEPNRPEDSTTVNRSISGDSRMVNTNTLGGGEQRNSFMRPVNTTSEQAPRRQLEQAPERKTSPKRRNEPKREVEKAQVTLAE